MAAIPTKLLMRHSLLELSSPRLRESLEIRSNGSDVHVQRIISQSTFKIQSFTFSDSLYERFFLLRAGPPKERGCRITEKPG